MRRPRAYLLGGLVAAAASAALTGLALLAAARFILAQLARLAP